VLTYISQKNISVNLKNTNESSNIHQELIDSGGKSQVPCLVVNGKPVYESRAIIEWFEQNWKIS